MGILLLLNWELVVCACAYVAAAVTCFVVVNALGVDVVRFCRDEQGIRIYLFLRICLLLINILLIHLYIHSSFVCLFACLFWSFSLHGLPPVYDLQNNSKSNLLKEQQ